MIDKRYSSGKRFLKYSEQELENARNTDMVEFLGRREGFSFINKGGWYVGREHDSIVINKDLRTWHWYSRDLFGKGAIDWLMKVDNMSFAEAAETLIGSTAESTYISNRSRDSPPVKDVTPPERKPFSPPPRKSGNYRETYAYLCTSRKLPADIVTYCVQNKLIYQDDNKRAIFCGYDKDGKMRFAEARITNTLKKYYPQNLSGSEKQFSFFIPADTKVAKCDPTQLYVFEAPIDLLSHAALMQKAFMKQCQDAGKAELYNPNCWLRYNRLSLSGVSTLSIEQRLKDNPQIDKIALCLDNDERGQTAAENIKNRLEKLDGKYKVKIVKPPQGKDWNDTLKAASLVSQNNLSVKPTSNMKLSKP